ncbi:MAG: HlyD family efflux transporter periplasmic adaptor subunit [Syntrophales bacterium]|nr:HlyD family efflux transporter periplasmic adaptor subunit [Syntrophales bacterium]MDD5640795.1 HlyD family efflux transporter periplasmic adaptor subunit [Syntrophales bacterium]
MVIAALLVWQFLIRGKGESKYIASANGRIEATEIDVAAKYAGRIKTILVDEGDFVTAGQVVARMDTEVLQAQLRQAEAQAQQAQSAIATARSKLAQRESEKAAAQATVMQRQAELDVARKRSARSSALALKAAVSQQEADDDQARVRAYEAAISAAQAQVAAATATIATARSGVLEAQSSFEAAGATVERIKADIDDSDLKAPRDGRIQYRVAQPLEVVGAGGRVLNMIDLHDVYMTFFLPTAEAGRVTLGSEVRLVLDAAPEYVIPAKVTFVADVAQFTPKTVETASEREKLMFRIKAHIPIDLLRKYVKQAKTGLPGMAYVKLDRQAEWPAHLQVKLPQ